VPRRCEQRCIVHRVQGRALHGRVRGKRDGERARHLARLGSLSSAPRACAYVWGGGGEEEAKSVSGRKNERGSRGLTHNDTVNENNRRRYPHTHKRPPVHSAGRNGYTGNMFRVHTPGKTGYGVFKGPWRCKRCVTRRRRTADARTALTRRLPVRRRLAPRKLCSAPRFFRGAQWQHRWRCTHDTPLFRVHIGIVMSFFFVHYYYYFFFSREIRARVPIRTTYCNTPLLPTRYDRRMEENKVGISTKRFVRSLCAGGFSSTCSSGDGECFARRTGIRRAITTSICSRLNVR
jgi:hypothetical protein